MVTEKDRESARRHLDMLRWKNTYSTLDKLFYSFFLALVKQSIKKA